jgi:hypothetical protein
MSGYAHVRNGSSATKLGWPCHVRYSPDSDRTADIDGGPVRAKPGSRNIPRSPRRRGANHSSWIASERGSPWRSSESLAT